jgi:stage V sporulation protein AA
MQQEILYIKLDKDVEVTADAIFLKDLGNIYCKNDAVVNGCKALKICKLQGEETRKVISVIKVIELITKEYPWLRIENIGETDIVVEHVKQEKRGKFSEVPKIIFVSLISFFGTAFTIMAFHNDIQLPQLFNNIHEMIRGTPTDGHSILEFTYSLGLGIGIIVFFNHIGGRRITNEPTPVEVSMKKYEDDVNNTIVDTAQRIEEEVETKK